MCMKPIPILLASTTGNLMELDISWLTCAACSARRGESTMIQAWDYFHAQKAYESTTIFKVESYISDNNWHGS
jgi:hypothetical protein